MGFFAFFHRFVWASIHKLKIKHSWNYSTCAIFVDLFNKINVSKVSDDTIFSRYIECIRTLWNWKIYAILTPAVFSLNKNSFCSFVCRTFNLNFPPSVRLLNISDANAYLSVHQFFRPSFCPFTCLSFYSCLSVLMLVCPFVRLLISINSCLATIVTDQLSPEDR